MAGARGYRRELENIQLRIQSETLIDPDIAYKKRKVISESSMKVGGRDILIVKYIQVLQSFIPDESSKDRNWNGRGYTEKTIVGHLNVNPIVQHELKAGPAGASTWVAEYGHPYEPNKDAAMARQNIIDPKFISNKINKYWVEGNLLMGECETLAGSWGETLAERILTNLPAMASLRSIGRTNAAGIVLPNGLWIITYDTVVRPSHKEAMQKGSGLIIPNEHSMNESVMSIDLDNDMAKQFILSESTRNIEMIAHVGNFKMETMKIVGNDITLQRVSEDGLQLETIFIPQKVLMNLNYHQLF